MPCKMFKCAIDEEISEVSVIKEFDLAISVAKNLAKPGYNVLFSPATSSFDLFNGFEERGDKFIEIVNAFDDFCIAFRVKCGANLPCRLCVFDNAKRAFYAGIRNNGFHRGKRAILESVNKEELAVPCCKASL